MSNPNNPLEPDGPPGIPASRMSPARSASHGLFWVSVAVVFAKVLSLVSQIILGHVLAVETYAIFGLAAAVIAMTAGFQNPNVGKALIQSTTRFSDLFRSYSAFSFLLGIVGTGVLISIGAIFSKLYEIPELFLVLVVTSFAIPFMSINTTLIAGLSLNYRFRDINIVDIKRSLFYYFVLIAVALLGAEELTMAIALAIGTLVMHILLLQRSGLRPTYFRLNPLEFVKIFSALRWVILAGFLLALAMRADYFVVGKVLTLEEFGYYAFAFMLVASLTIPISTGITQIFLPIFAHLQHDEMSLRREIIRFSSAIVILGAGLCLVILGFNEVLIHLLWGGKWDPASVVVSMLAIAMPFRFLGIISGVGFEALGRWRLRNAILAFEATLLAVFAAIGASLGGIEGAIIGVVVQRVISSLISFAILGKLVRIDQGEVWALVFRLYGPFVAASALLMSMALSSNGFDAGFNALWLAGLETLVALAVFGAMAFLWNRTFVLVAFDLLRRRVRGR